MGGYGIAISQQYTDPDPDTPIEASPALVGTDDDKDKPCPCHNKPQPPKSLKPLDACKHTCGMPTPPKGKKPVVEPNKN